MKRYRSHKVVEAAPIQRVCMGCVIVDGEGSDLNRTIIVPNSLFARGEPARGDYLVRYEPTASDPDGYLSWWPKVAFEAGYTEIS